ncbi:unnamed protein product [Effrenium voratum]|nr:unnamed protein product [Effrenium voratum]
MASDATLFLEVARRSADQSFRPKLARLKARLAEAHLQKRPFNVLGIGPSNTAGVGCTGHGLRWTDALQFLSNSSQLKLNVTNAARRAKPFKEAWPSVLQPYKDTGALDLIIVDFAVTAQDVPASRHQTMLMHRALNQWRSPPALLYFETYTGRAIETMQQKKVDQCLFAADLENLDPFYAVLKSLGIPVLSYPDIACEMTRGQEILPHDKRIPYLYSVEASHHYSCGVHLIQAQAMFLYLSRLLQEACDHGFQTDSDSDSDSSDTSPLSLEDQCQLSLVDYWSFFSGAGFPATVAKADSAWKFGADRAGKYGWIAHWDGKSVGGDTGGKVPDTKIKFADLPQHDILFHVSMTLGLVLVEYLSTYANIGAATCLLEDPAGHAVSEAVRINALWSEKVSLSSQVTLSADLSKLKDRGKKRAVVRCKSEGQKFKILAISSC